MQLYNNEVKGSNTLALASFTFKNARKLIKNCNRQNADALIVSYLTFF
jgi:hypothetical protein